MSRCTCVDDIYRCAWCDLQSRVNRLEWERDETRSAFETLMEKCDNMQKEVERLRKRNIKA